MRNVSIARRYARALLDVASEAGSPDRVLDQLTGLARLVSGHPDLARVLENPALAKAQQRGVVEGLISASGGLDPALANLLRVMVDRGRLPFLRDVARIYRDLADVRAGRVRGKITSAVPMGEDALRKLEQALERILQRDVVLEAQVDRALIGGVAAQVGPVLFDGSLRTQLDDLRRSLMAR